MTRLAAHRGGARLWPENSLRAFRESLALGVDLVEADIHLTADGELAVIHDATLRRTTDRRGRVRTRTAAELRRARLRGPDRRLTNEHVPMLEEVLALVAAAGGGVLVEVKAPGRGLGVRYFPRSRIRPGARYQGLEERVIAALSSAKLLERANVMSFNPAVIERTRTLAPTLRTTLLVSAMHIRLARARPAETIAWALRYGATDVGLKHTLVDEAVVEAARAAGVRVGVWTVNDEPEMRRLIGLGVDVLTSDRPDVALRALGR
ncbi:MAG TPA: glycerophosphodiester phosphodiesterase family protein [Methylomirabilota bacterium]